MKPLILLRGAAFSCAVTFMSAGVALASNYGANTPLHLNASTSTHEPIASSGSIVRTVVGLAIVIAVIYGLGWVMRYAKTHRNHAVGTGLEQIATLPLGTNRAVSLVRVGSELHLLGLAEHGVQPIRTFTREEALAAGLPVSSLELSAPEGEPAPAPINRAIESLRKLTVRG